MITAEEWISRSWTNFADFIREIQADALECAAEIADYDYEDPNDRIRALKPRAKWSNPNST